jgi:hypothetical protein
MSLINAVKELLQSNAEQESDNLMIRLIVQRIKPLLTTTTSSHKRDYVTTQKKDNDEVLSKTVVKQ